MLTSMRQLSPRDLLFVLHTLVTDLRGKDNRACPIPLNRTSPSIPVEYTAKPHKHQNQIQHNSTQNTRVSTFPVRLPCKSAKLLLRNPKRPFRTQPSKNSWSESKPTTLHCQCALSNPRHTSHIAECTNVQTPKGKIHRNPQLKIPTKKCPEPRNSKPALGGRGLEIRDPTAAIARARENPQPPLANAARDGIRGRKGASPSSKGCGSTRFLNRGNLAMAPQLLQVMRRRYLAGRIISNWLLCSFVMVLRFCVETVCLGRRLHSRERGERGEQREGRERSRTRGALEACVGGQPLWYQHF